MRTWRLIVQAMTAAATALAAVRYRRWHLRWGATDDELAMRLPGDEMVPHPHFAFTRAITIRARPEEIYPWLVQIGWGRAGWYSYDVLDNLGKHSAEEIVPELQDIQAGDWVSMGGKPTETTAMRVRAFERNKWLLWEHQGCPWVWHLEPIDPETTRLVTRGRNRYRIDWTLPTALILMEVGDPFMMRRQLRNVKRRAEGLAAQRKATALAAFSPGVAVPTAARTATTTSDDVVEVDVDIDRPVEVVFDYCSDHRNEIEWNPKMRGVAKLTEGPVGVGTRYEMAFLPGRSMVSECVRFEPPTRWAVEGQVHGFRSGLEGRIAPTPAGSHLVLRMDFSAQGVRRLMLPRLRRHMSSDLALDIGLIKTTLERSGGVSPTVGAKRTASDLQGCRSSVDAVPPITS